jgi:AraC-like DNA-binding protein
MNKSLVPMSFTTYIPCDPLKPFVRSFAISSSESASSYKIVPGTSIVMGFQYSGKLSYSSEDKSIPLHSSGITGLMDTFRIFSNTDHTGSVLVLFTETGASAFFKDPLYELFNQSLALDDLVLRSQMDVVSEQICEARSNEGRIRVVENFLLSRLKNAVPDELVALAVGLIQQTNGNIRIALLAEKLNISQSRLEKRFRKVVGASPKKFATIVRLRHILGSETSRSELTGLALDAGYFDQAHFIKDFKSFTGQTPEQYFAQQ